jgi:DNA-binding LytR/AlgR family response regulator
LEVVYFEAADKYVRVLTAEREYLMRTPLKDLLPRLNPRQFWQIHRGTVVNSAHIARVLRDKITLRTRPEILSVSRLYAQQFRAM